jgi:Zn-dependent M28 family amino/carboxypeptidase
VKNENWRPRRTIIFASWAAEEYGLTGSREFVEDFVAKLSQRAVVYLNVDICSGEKNKSIMTYYLRGSSSIRYTILEDF